MKKLKLFLMMFVAAAMCTGFVACSDDDDSPATPSIIGTWVNSANADESSMTVTFNKNLTGTLNLKYTSTDINEKFEYVYDSDDEVLNIIGSTLEGQYELTITVSTLRLYFYSGGSRKYYEFTRKK
ncbi:hypothetical protein [Alistipes senegalensis]|uniref:hypothetical protein n=1 Tax=Alistipes senegalensis TaxID=1288121 RepID=UPI00242F202D|nr:hypothetical protein [Alistipes senegalensis]MCI7306801.1 hypothetical protein [Alistipes senegalensis]MDD7040292.1 hypothetical protein [Alistipes senegalensis]MDY2877325.1 hypothetical protein [Alistipes senegalensis]